MIQILEYITENYTWFLCGSIVILLAIIGYYADKSLAQSKNKDKQTEEIKDVGIADITNSTPVNKESEIIQESQNVAVDNSNKINENNIENDVNVLNSSKNEIRFDPQTGQPINMNEGVNLKQSVVNHNLDPSRDLIQVNNTQENKQQEGLDAQINLNEEKSTKNTISLVDKKIETLDNELKNLLPQKETIDTDLLDDIEGLNFDTTIKGSNFMDIPDLDNIKLPKIKNLVDKEQDIWKF